MRTYLKKSIGVLLTAAMLFSLLTAQAYSVQLFSADSAGTTVFFDAQTANITFDGRTYHHDLAGQESSIRLISSTDARIDPSTGMLQIDYEASASSEETLWTFWTTGGNASRGIDAESMVLRMAAADPNVAKYIQVWFTDEHGNQLSVCELDDWLSGSGYDPLIPSTPMEYNLDFGMSQVPRDIQNIHFAFNQSNAAGTMWMDLISFDTGAVFEDFTVQSRTDRVQNRMEDADGYLPFLQTPESVGDGYAGYNFAAHQTFAASTSDANIVNNAYSDGKALQVCYQQTQYHATVAKLQSSQDYTGKDRMSITIKGADDRATLLPHLAPLDPLKLDGILNVVLYDGGTKIATIPFNDFYLAADADGQAHTDMSPDTYQTYFCDLSEEYIFDTVAFEMDSDKYSAGRYYIKNITLSDPIVWGGTDGDTPETAYIISTPEDLALLAQKVKEGAAYENKYFTLVNDISLNDWLADNSNIEGWEPIGTDTNRFKGTIDGQGYIISGLWINRSTDNQGLFGSIEGGAIVNLKVEINNVKGGVKGGKFTGGLAAVSRSDIDNCSVTGNVTGGNNTGGLVGWSDQSVTRCYVTGDVTGGNATGGLLGLHNEGAVTNSYTVANVTGSYDVGGLAGHQKGTIANSYAAGNVTGEQKVGGLSGCIDGGSIIHCYASGDVSGNWGVGGVAGYCNGSIIGCYRYAGTRVSGIRVAANDENSAPDKTHGGAISASELWTQATYEDNGWDFVAVWEWDGDYTYPRLRGFEKEDLSGNLTDPQSYPFGFYFDVSPYEEDRQAAAQMVTVIPHSLISDGRWATSDGENVPTDGFMPISGEVSMPGGVSYLHLKGTLDGAEVTELFGPYNVAVKTLRSGGGSTFYTVTFNSNGGTPVSSQTVSRNAKLTKPDDPTREGYVFDGWFIDGALTKEYAWGSSVMGTITLYAKWNIATESMVEIGDIIDVSENDWFYGDVEYVLKNGLMGGTSENTFSPQMGMTRAMLVTVLWRQEGSPKAANMPFTDIAADAYYYDAVAWAASPDGSGAENGIVMGIGGGLFDPDTEITREQMAAIFARYAGWAKIEFSETRQIVIFADSAEISEYAKSAVETLYRAGIINGKDGNIFDPKGNATRAEAAAMLHSCGLKGVREVT